MKSKLFFGMIVCVALTIGLVLAGCPTDGGDDGGGNNTSNNENNTGNNGNNTGNSGNTGNNTELEEVFNNTPASQGADQPLSADSLLSWEGTFSSLSDLTAAGGELHVNGTKVTSGSAMIQPNDTVRILVPTQSGNNNGGDDNSGGGDNDGGGDNTGNGGNNTGGNNTGGGNTGGNNTGGGNNNGGDDNSGGGDNTGGNSGNNTDAGTAVEYILDQPIFGTCTKSGNNLTIRWSLKTSGMTPNEVYTYTSPSDIIIQVYDGTSFDDIQNLSSSARTFTLSDYAIYQYSPEGVSGNRVSIRVYCTSGSNSYDSKYSTTTYFVESNYWQPVY
jgi:hypothetical protein